MTQPPPLPCPYCNAPVQRGWKACPACGGVFNLLTPLTQLPPAPGYPPPQTVIVMQPKSVGLAFLLALLFGPLGLLYSTVTGFLVTFVAALALGVVTGGLGACLLWPVCLLWAIGAASSSKQVPTYATGGQGRALLGASLPLTTRRLIVGGIFALFALLVWLGNTVSTRYQTIETMYAPTPIPPAVAVVASIVTVPPDSPTPTLPLPTDTATGPTTTPDVAALRQAQAEGDRATAVAAVLATQTAEAQPTNTPRPPTAIPPPPPLNAGSITATDLRAGFQPANYDASRYQDQFSYTITFASRLPKAIRVFRGTLTLSDPFGKTLQTLNLTDTDGLPANGTHIWRGTSQYNQFIEANVQLRQYVESGTLSFDWALHQVIYTDGTSDEVTQ